MEYFLPLSYLIFWNVLAFILMGIDKKRARERKKCRIPESTLFSAAILGGALGAILGMQIFRHKTKHIKFQIGMPVILCLQIVVAVWLVVIFRNFSFLSPIILAI